MQQRYLFVMTRDIVNHPSAIHILRIALGLQRRREQVTVFLTDDAARVLPHESSAPPLLRLVSAGAVVLTDADVPAHLRGEIGVERAQPEMLAELLTSPGVQAHWC